ncbi:hypothetical protein BH09PAT1_BH09PAT1_8710 [soil metagenome]
MELLSGLVVGILSPDDPNYRSTQYISWLEQIKDQLSSLRQDLHQHAFGNEVPYQSESVAVRELFVLATLLYLERQSTQLVGPSAKTDELAKDGFTIFSKLDQCNKLFPLFTFGCEAQTDSRRLLILDIIDRTLKNVNTSSLIFLREVLVKLWVLTDLDIERSVPDTRSSCFFLETSNCVLCLL